MNRPIFQRTKLIRAPMGYFRTRPADVWPFRPLPPPRLLSAKLLGRFPIRKRHLIAPDLNFPNMLQNVICYVTDDVTARVKGKITVLSLLASPGKAAVSN